MQFSYQAISQNGIKQKGLLDANNQKEVIEYLRVNNLTPLKIVQEKKSDIELLNYFNRIKTGDIVIFTRQLASMTQTGLTLIESLTILRDQSTKPKMRQMVVDIIGSISEGNSFSQALAEHTNVFSEVYIALIRAAETGGLLDKVLGRLADNMEKSEDLKKRVKGALFYPLIVMVGVIGVIVVMNVFVIPQLGKLYEGLNVTLPLSTRIVLGMSSFFVNFYPLIIILIIITYVLFRRYRKTKSGIQVIDRVKLKAPIIGGIESLSILDEVCRTLSLLISSGSSIIDSLNITANVSNNYRYKSAILAASELVEKGINLSTALENQNIFPPVMIQMVRVGETTGKIDESLGRVAQYYERDLDIKIKTLTTAIEPILLMVLGVTVGFLIISVITPIYSLISSIQ